MYAVNLYQVFEGLPDGFSEDQDTVVRYMKLLPPVFSDEDRRAEAARVSLKKDTAVTAVTSAAAAAAEGGVIWSALLEFYC